MSKRISTTRILDVPTLPTPATLPPNASVGKRWRFRRDLVIYISSRNRVPQRWLAEVFDLPHSRIASIVKNFDARYGETAPS